MPKIHQLPPHIIAKIAAGEVIERPAFAVKELLENAIDAGATDIRIYLENAGLSKIQVIDNGEGMEREDLLEAWKPHTTSKISEKDFLMSVKSLGFRGEALASLAAISTLTIKSRTIHSPTGTEIQVNEGKLQQEKPTGMPQGTVVTVENLFQHVPARKKFMKSTSTELRHIIDVFNRVSLSHPAIHFTLQHNKKTIADFAPVRSFAERTREIIGEQPFKLFLPVKFSESYVEISGFIAKPQLNASTQSKQFLFINKRPVTDKLISLAVKEAFGTMLEPTSYPLFLLEVTLPYEMVDVNVHPRKEQVSFANGQILFQITKQAIQEVLQENNITFQNLSWKRKGVGMTSSYAGQLLKQAVLDKNQLIVDKEIAPVQLYKLYIVTQTQAGIIFTDQHGAHERVLFEKLKKEFIRQKNKGNSFVLPQPITLALSPSYQLLLNECKKHLLQLGFVFQQANIIAVPTLFSDRDPQELLFQFLEEFEQERPTHDIDAISEEMLAFLACRAAVKAGDTLSQMQMQMILGDLEHTPNKATCPHGRPTQMVFEKEYIDSLFKR